jgi:hypothetical protein
MSRRSSASPFILYVDGYSNTSPDSPLVFEEAFSHQLAADNFELVFRRFLRGPCDEVQPALNLCIVQRIFVAAQPSNHAYLLRVFRVDGHIIDLHLNWFTGWPSGARMSGLWCKLTLANLNKFLLSGHISINQSILIAVAKAGRLIQKFQTSEYSVISFSLVAKIQTIIDPSIL